MEKSTGDRDWRAYYTATHGRPPRATLLRALAAAAGGEAPPGRRAIDLGCGGGRDTLPMLQAGWHVLAIDAEPEAIALLGAVTPKAFRPRLTRRVARFERTVLPPAELVNASFSLFFAERWAALACLFGQIERALVPGGRFAGHLLGRHDSWVPQGRTLGLTRGEVVRLLGGLRIERLEEEETDAVTPRGEAKHWHIWHVNAMKSCRTGAVKSCRTGAVRSCRTGAVKPRRTGSQGFFAEKLSLCSSPLSRRRILA